MLGQPFTGGWAVSRGVQHQWEMRASLLAPSTSLTHGDPLAPPSRVVEDGRLPGGGSLPFSTLVCSFPPCAHPQALRTILSRSPTQGHTWKWAGREAQVKFKGFFSLVLPGGYSLKSSHRGSFSVTRV